MTPSTTVTSTTFSLTPPITSISTATSGTTASTSASGLPPLFSTMPFNRVTLPDFLHSNPSLWFTLADRQFRTHKVTDPDEILGILCTKLPPDVVARACDILQSNESADSTLAKLKARIISLYNVSDEEKLDELLKNVSLGTKKPSVLLTEMRLLAGQCPNEDLLKRLWLRRLPPRMQEHLSIHKVPLDSLAVMADSLHAVMLPSIGSIASLTPQPEPSPQPNAPPQLSSFEQMLSKKIEELTAQVAALTAHTAQISAVTIQNQRQSRGRDRDRSEDRPRNRSRSRSRTYAYCWYHYKFGADATKCTQPCKFVPLVPPTNQEN
ncbi:uncharacterized protein LOC135843217 [Planococcus citri]|uniref:uncharacterized protein LOC135843217 n=1 Tax=Planococcus citri TaxID=170843 RepID=UPI0031F85B15